MTTNTPGGGKKTNYLCSEEKCRRCGHISQLVFSEDRVQDREMWEKWKPMVINEPGIRYCDKCKCDTVQDCIGFPEVKI